MQAERLRLQVENLEGESIALLGACAQRQNLLLRRGGGSGEFVIWILLDHILQQLGQSGDGRIGFDAAPVATTAAAVGFQSEQVQGHRHVTGFHAGEIVAIQRQAIRINIGAAQPRPRSQHDNTGLAIATHAGGFGDATVVAVVPGDQRNRAAGLGRQGPAVLRMKVPAGERQRQIRGPVQHAVALVGTGDGQAHAPHIRPSQLVVGEETFDSLDPALDHRGGAGLGVGRTLAQLHGDDRAIGADAAGLGRGGSAVGADVDVGGGAHGEKRGIAPGGGGERGRAVGQGQRTVRHTRAHRSRS